MNGKYNLYLFLIFIIGLIGLWGCPKKSEVTSLPESPKKAEAVAPAAPSAETKPEMKPEAAPEKTEMAAEGLKPIYFDFDKSSIRDDAKPVMQADAEWLKAHPDVKIRIEGSCDERGAIEYNQALGQRRAESAKKYLAALGISGHRVVLISYGKEKPICYDHDEACWQKNRKDDLVVVTR